MQNKIRIKREIGQQHGIYRADKPEHHICNCDVLHQIFKAEIWMLAAESVNKAFGMSHTHSPEMGYYYYKYTLTKKQSK